MANVQLTVYNWDSGPHPSHFHGHDFQVVQKGFDVTSEEPGMNPPLIEKQRDPMRDTVTIPGTGKVVLRWRADHPGAWFFHCHVDWHLSLGLVAVFIEAPERFQEITIIPQAIYDHCKYWGLPTSGNVVGLNATTIMDGQPSGPFPLVISWTPQALGSILMCNITTVFGMATAIWYNRETLNKGTVEEDHQPLLTMQHEMPDKIDKSKEDVG
ncbi:uncharacterized protein L203_104706 [Cryptococcus depauperatus CBS 7841]|uniref:Plastocyanin-like domain-containing protein n=1 Tax=Cryptococcus depauperatus CBS 7841 TaxID=1295531 RepID=A0AAJ8JVY6_9TREE